MATWKPELHNIESIIAYYEQYDAAPYKVFAGHKPEDAYCRFVYDEHDKEVGREKLLAALQSVAGNPDNTNTYLLQICQMKGRKLEPVNSITFQLNKVQQYYPMQQSMAGLDSIMAKMNAIEQRLAMQELEDEEEEEEPEQPNILNGILNSPQMQNVFINLIANAIGGGSKPAAVAGVPDEDKQNLLTEALQILKKNDPELELDLFKLAQISEQNPEQFKFLISMLRKQ